MIGNDVVDLKTAAVESNWRRKGYLEKIFSPRERALLSSGGDLHSTVWLLWSMKEAAYKAWQRQFHLPRSINWHAFECSLDRVSSGKASGKVGVGERKYFTASEITSEMVHTSARNTKTIPLKNGIFEASSPKTKKEFLQQIAKLKSIPFEDLSLQKNLHGIPYISYNNRVLPYNFSFSDHGRFSAFSLSLIMS